MDVQLSHTTAARLLRPVRGRGGFQSLLRRLQPRIQSGVLAVDHSDYEKLERYSNAYGRGGFQGRTTGAALEIQQVLEF